MTKVCSVIDALIEMLFFDHFEGQWIDWVCNLHVECPFATNGFCEVFLEGKTPLVEETIGSFIDLDCTIFFSKPVLEWQDSWTWDLVAQRLTLLMQSLFETKDLFDTWAPWTRMVALWTFLGLRLKFFVFWSFWVPRTVRATFTTLPFVIF